jgi:hypothetical protein
VHNISSTSDATSAPAATFSFGAASPASTFGTPAPTSTFGTGAPSFGSTAPAPQTAFNSTTTGYNAGFGMATPATGFAFGNPALANTGFGMQPPSTSLFGGGGGPFPAAPSSIPFGQPQQTQQPSVTAQAALQAHMDELARQEEARIIQAFQKIQNAYAGTDPATEEKSAKFTTIVYNPLTPEMKNQQWLQGLGIDGKSRPVAPPRPPQICERDWNEAIVRNPDFSRFMPVPIVGAVALQLRLSYQQQMADMHTKILQELERNNRFLSNRSKDVRNQLEYLKSKYNIQRKRLLAVIQKVELVRTFNQPLQTDEIKCMQRLGQLYRGVEDLRRMNLHGTPHIQLPANATLPDELKPVLQEHRAKLGQLTHVLNHEDRDLQLILQRLRAVVPAAFQVESEKK